MRRVPPLDTGPNEREPDGEPNDLVVNLSNHPACHWSSLQLMAARTLGARLLDVPFPAVPPDVGLTAVEELADEMMAKLPKATIAVHLAGEATLVVALLARLRQRGIRCVASTTERCLDRNGARIFKFVRFRDYPEPREVEPGESGADTSQSDLSELTTST